MQNLLIFPILLTLTRSLRLARYIAKHSDCELATVGDNFGLQEYGYVFPKGSKLRDAFSEAIANDRASQWTNELEQQSMFILIPN